MAETLSGNRFACLEAFRRVPFDGFWAFQNFFFVSFADVFQAVQAGATDAKQQQKVSVLLLLVFQAFPRF